MRNLDGEDMFWFGLGIAALVLIFGVLAILGWDAVHDIRAAHQRADDQAACARAGGRVERSLPPHDDDWHCTGATVERAP